MKKRIISLSILLFIVSVIFLVVANQFTANAYDLNFMQYLKYSSPLTTDEKEFLKERGTIKFVSDKNAPPFSFVDSSNGQYKGLALDYTNALSLVLGIKVTFVPQEWNKALKSVENGDADVCDMFTSVERQKHFIFSNPIYRVRDIIATRSGDTSVQKFEDLSRKKVGIPSGDFAIEFVKKNSKDISIIETEDINMAIEQLLNGNVDAIIGDEPVILYISNQLKANDKIRVISPSLFEKEVCLGVKKNETTLIEILNKGILKLKKENLVQNIQQKWFGISVPISKDRLPQNILLGILFLVGTLAIVFIIAYISNNRLKSEVDKRTKELDRSRHDLQMSFDALAAYIIVISSDGFVKNANEAFCSWVNLEKSKVIDIEYHQFEFIEHIYKNYEIEKNWLCNINQDMLKYKDRFYNISIINLTDSDQILIFADDATDQIASQQQLIQDHKMIAIGQLAAGVAHEIRNPLGNIRNYCYILKNRIESDDPIIAKCVSVIESSVQKGGDIIDNLLNFSRTENGGYKNTNILDMFESIVLLERTELSNRNIEIEINCDKELTILIKLESMNHIVLNLIANSKDALPSGGRIVINVTFEKEVLYLEFIDNGVGIPEDAVNQIFNPFFTTKISGEGTGLGLYIVYNEVVKMGGKLQVESKLGNGTTFLLQIPCKEGKAND